MIIIDADNTYPDIVRYWSHDCEEYAGGDALFTLLDEGWTIAETIFYETYWHSGSTDIYDIELVKDSTVMFINVIDNPYVQRFVRPYRLICISFKRSRYYLKISEEEYTG